MVSSDLSFTKEKYFVNLTLQIDTFDRKRLTQSCYFDKAAIVLNINTLMAQEKVGNQEK